MASPIEQLSACPRCGYDQSGAISTWRESCPVSGICPECGHDFWWGDVIAPRLGNAPRLFEHARTGRAFACVRSIVMASRPERLWNVLRMHHPVRVRRLCILAIVGWIAYAVALALVAVGVSWGAAWVSVEFVIPVSSGGTAVGPLRYWNGLDGVLILGVRFERFRLAWGASGWSISVQSWWPCWSLLASALTPVIFAALPETRRLHKVRWVHVLRIWAYAIPTVPLPIALWSIMQVAGEELERADLVANGWNSGGDSWMAVGSRILLVSSSHALILCTTLWSWWYWRAACRKYLAIPHPRLVSFLAVILSGLLALAVLTSFPGAAVSLMRQLWGQIWW